MHLPFSKSSVRYSERNGVIVINAEGEVLAFGARQTSVRYEAMWGDALAKTPVARKVSKVLMLGLAGGGALAPIHAAYPGTTVTAVEYDPTMVEVARDLHKDSLLPFPRVIVADAQDALNSLTEEFDLILVDIFVGPRPSMLISDGRFWAALRSRLAAGGSVTLNVAGDSTRVYDAQKHFERSTCWQYNANTFCALFT